MATVASIAIRRANATARIEAATKALGEHFGVPLPEPVSNVVRDADLRRAAEQERMADLLEAVATASGAIVEEPEQEPEQEPDGPNLARMKRDELNRYAREHGINDPDSYGTKGELIAALETAEEADDGAADGD